MIENPTVLFCTLLIVGFAWVVGFAWARFEWRVIQRDYKAMTVDRADDPNYENRQRTVLYEAQIELYKRQFTNGEFLSKS